jgi:hypothetical protein
MRAAQTSLRGPPTGPQWMKSSTTCPEIEKQFDALKSLLLDHGTKFPIGTAYDLPTSTKAPRLARVVTADVKIGGSDTEGGSATGIGPVESADTSKSPVRYYAAVQDAFTSLSAA